MDFILGILCLCLYVFVIGVVFCAWVLTWNPDAEGENIITQLMFLLARILIPVASFCLGIWAIGKLFNIIKRL